MTASDTHTSPALTGFPPITRADAETLILGSMPGVASLQAARYYAHPRNAFWPIMSALYQQSIDHYDDGVALLHAQKLALWDVLASCERRGSLDASIQQKTAQANDFNTFFKEHTNLARIVFNGTAAATLFKRQVTLPSNRTLVVRQAPSTSPAMATLTVVEKTEKWRACLF